MSLEQTPITRKVDGAISMEVAVYIVSMALFVLSMPTVYRKRYSLLSVCYMSFCVFVLMPSLPVYLQCHANESMHMYFVSVMIFQASLLAALLRSPLGSTPPSSFHDRCMDRVTTVQPVVAVAIVLVALSYLVIGAVAYGGTLPLVDFMRTGSFPVLFRMTFWRSILPNIPLSSVLRFVAKAGTLHLGLRLVHTGRKRSGITVMMVALLTSTMEGTKAGFYLWALPIAAYVLLSPKSSRWALLLLGLVTVSGTLWTALLEARFEWRVALIDKLLSRAFAGPAYVSQTHFLLANQLRQGDAYLMGISRLKEAALPLGALDWDNYVMRCATFQRAGYVPTYGGMNAPAFVYGWVDYGVLGVLVVSVLSACLLQAIDNHIHKGLLSKVFAVSAIPHVIMLATSIRFSNAMLGVEGLVGLLILDGCIGYRRTLTSTPGMWLLMLAGVANYVLGTLLARVTL